MRFQTYVFWNCQWFAKHLQDDHSSARVTWDSQNLKEVLARTDPSNQVLEESGLFGHVDEQPRSVVVSAS